MILHLPIQIFCSAFFVLFLIIFLIAFFTWVQIIIIFTTRFYCFYHYGEWDFLIFLLLTDFCY